MEAPAKAAGESASAAVPGRVVKVLEMDLEPAMEEWAAEARDRRPTP